VAKELNKITKRPDQEYVVDNMASMDRPMPGSSLTNDPDQPFPFEKAPEYTNVREASEYIFETLIEEETYIPLMGAIAEGYPLMDVTKALLFKGFSEGKWNPDLLMLLAEPLAYMLMALAERADIDFVIYRGEEEDAEENEELLGTKYDEKKMKELRKARQTREIPKAAIPAEVLARLDEAPVESLLEPSEPPEEEPKKKQPQSLMAPPV
jgi:hypothetical protein|tara:strand:+ start:5548 stop:6177 length:630 start_codon:yes stop_codon:yes gene_type:complete